MIDLYTGKTPNGRKASIMLEEIGLPYDLHPIDFSKREQYAPAYLVLNPNNKIPTIVDRDGPGGKPYTVFESGAILMYLADKTGQLMPIETGKRYLVIQWLMFQMGGVGPMFGQANHFIRSQEKNAYGIERYSNETRRLYAVLNKRLGEVEFLAGDYSIADIATYPWVGRHDWHQVNLEEFPNVHRWFTVLGNRAAVQRGMEIP